MSTVICRSLAEPASWLIARRFMITPVSCSGVFRFSATRSPRLSVTQPSLAFQVRSGVPRGIDAQGPLPPSRSAAAGSAGFTSIGRSSGAGAFSGWKITLRSLRAGTAALDHCWVDDSSRVRLSSVEASSASESWPLLSRSETRLPFGRRSLSAPSSA